jgi:hypothetical protein
MTDTADLTDTGAGPDRRLDGNAAAGALRELFAVDLTAALCTCAHCGATAPLGRHDLYADAPALVLRCPGCTAVVLRYAAVGGRVRLDMAGTRLLEVDVTDVGQPDGSERDTGPSAG